MDPLVPTKESEEPTTVTRVEIILQRRARVVELAAELGNISAACRIIGVSRTSFYEWQAVAETYGLEALLPKPRRRPQLPNETPTHVVAELLVLAAVQPTLGARRLADLLAERGLVVSATTVQKILNDHRLGRRAQRLARAAAIAAQTTGLVTEITPETPWGFCHWAPRPGALVAVDTFYIGHLKGVGKVYQLTAVDTATRFAMISIVLGPVTAAHSLAFAHHVRRGFRRLGFQITGMLTDGGPEWIAGDFRAGLAAMGIDHHRIPPRSPNHNAVVERFHGTGLQECWRPAFHRRRFTTLGQLQAEANAWLVGYNTRRRNHGNFMRGRTPRQVLDSHRPNKTT
jgi:transposase InsO family protein